MVTTWRATRALVYETAWNMDTQTNRHDKLSAMAKWYPTEVAQDIIDQGVQLLGARGLVSYSPLEKLYRQIRALRVYEGTTEVMKIIIAKEVLREARD
jgi:acyl-CoA dehydrogenase